MDDEAAPMVIFGALIIKQYNPHKSPFECYEDAKHFLGEVYEIHQRDLAGQKHYEVVTANLKKGSRKKRKLN